MMDLFLWQLTSIHGPKRSCNGPAGRMDGTKPLKIYNILYIKFALNCDEYNISICTAKIYMRLADHEDESVCILCAHQFPVRDERNACALVPQEKYTNLNNNK